MTHPPYVESKDVRFTRREVVTDRDGAATLHLAGFIFHSGLAVAGTRVERKGPAMLVMVALRPVGAGHDGNFAVDIRLDKPDQQVRFGPSDDVVWPVEGAR